MEARALKRLAIARAFGGAAFGAASFAPAFAPATLLRRAYSALRDRAESMRLRGMSLRIWKGRPGGACGSLEVGLRATGVEAGARAS